jgi:hypothetical protein
MMSEKETQLRQTLEYLKIENCKADKLMKVVRVRERALNTCLKIAEEVLQPLLNEFEPADPVWEKLSLDDFNRHLVTIRLLKGDKSETIEDIMGNTMRTMDETQRDFAATAAAASISNAGSKKRMFQTMK